MKCAVALLLTMFWAAEAIYERNPPKVQLYSHNPGKYGNGNILICQVSEFHPPDITIQLMHNGHELPKSRQTDLAFTSKWHFHLMRSANFTPQRGEKFLCRVTHGDKSTDYEWEPNM